jgi:hypothetical protein
MPDNLQRQQFSWPKTTLAGRARVDQHADRQSAELDVDELLRVPNLRVPD